jgi:predicted hydrocarbon binding protein
MPATVDALLPLSLLVSVRGADTPADADAEYVHEARNRRLGLSDTVYAQIQRYTDDARRNRRLPIQDALAIATLIGRRPDAETVFRSAGKRLAGQMYESISTLRRWFLRFLPAFVSRPMALAAGRQLSRRYLNGSLRRVGGYVMLAVGDSATVGTAPLGIGCTFYEATFGELLCLLVDGGGAIEHVRCAGRGEGSCEWRAEWR